MKITYTIQEAANHIENLLKNIQGSEYFFLELDGEEVKIRVSDHSANHNNNSCRTLSFCTNFVKHSGFGKGNMVDEWIVDENGYCDDLGRYVEDILDWELD